MGIAVPHHNIAVIGMPRHIHAGCPQATVGGPAEQAITLRRKHIKAVAAAAVIDLLQENEVAEASIAVQ